MKDYTFWVRQIQINLNAILNTPHGVLIFVIHMNTIIVMIIKILFTETTNQDWWFVRKHLTEEKGWVPAQYLMDEANYTLYLQKKLNEKIDKLPVFESEYCSSGSY